jgi:hypothetical protein
VLAVREDGCVVPRQPAHDAKAPSSRVVLPASDVTVACPEQEWERASAPPAHFNDAQAEQALWKEFRDHGASLNNTLNEALWIHAGPAWRVFQMCVLVVEFEVSLVASASAHFLTLFSSTPCSLVTSWRAELGRGMTASIS